MQHAIYQLIPINSLYYTVATVLFCSCIHSICRSLFPSFSSTCRHLSPLNSSLCICLLNICAFTHSLFLLDRGHIDTWVWNLFYTLKENQLQPVTGMSMCAALWYFSVVHSCVSGFVSMSAQVSQMPVTYEVGKTLLSNLFKEKK